MPMKVEKDWKKGREWVMEFIKENIGVEFKVVNCRESGTVVVIKLKNDETKKEVMRNKHKLKGGRVFIKRFELGGKKNAREINRWAKIQREKRIKVKIGIGTASLKVRWRNWNKTLKEKEEREGIGEDSVSEMREERGKEDIGEERKERKGRIGMDKDRKADEARRDDRRKETDGDKGTEKNLE